MSDQNLGSFQTGGGLAESLEGTIEDPYFDYDPEYRDGETPLLHLPLVAVTTDDDAEVPDTLELTLGVGNGWEVVDNGASIERVDGKKAQIHPSTRLGLLIDRAVDIGLVDILAERGEAWDADIWDGLRLRFEQYEHDYGKIGDDDEKTIVTFLLPTELIEVEGETASGNGQVDEKVVTKLKALAKNSDDHDEFLNKALDVDGVTDDDNLFEQVSDAGDSGFYAQNAA